MSGGHWGYMSYRIHDHADWVGEMLHMLAEMEQLVDWVVCNDSDPQEAKDEIFEMLVGFFDKNATRIGR